MAVPTNTAQTVDITGAREDLSDEIYRLEDNETVLLKAFGKGTASGELHEWQTDDLATPTHVAFIDGDDLAASAIQPTVRLGNYIQTTAVIKQVSHRTDAISKAGRKKEMAYQLTKAGIEIKQNIEKTISGKQGGVANNGTVASECAGLATWMYDNTVGSATVAAHTTGAPTTDVVDGAGAALTNANIKTVQQAAYDAGGRPTLLVVGTFNRNLVDGFSSKATPQNTVGKTGAMAVNDYVDVIVNSFGQLMVKTSTIIPQDLAYILEPEKFSVDYLDGIKMIELAKTGLSTKKGFTCDFTLRANNPKGSGMVGNTTVA